MKNSETDKQHSIARERALWRAHLAHLTRHITSAIPFDVPVIDLDKYGLTPMMRAYSPQEARAQFSSQVFEEVQDPLVIYQETVFWTFEWDGAHGVEQFAFRMAAYNRRNRCHLHLNIRPLSELNEPGDICVHIEVDCLEVLDNSYFPMDLGTALSPGKYRCEIHSPDADVENAVALFVSLPMQTVDFDVDSDRPKSLSLPTAAEYQTWYLHHACREEALSVQRETSATVSEPVVFSILVPHAAAPRLYNSLLQQTWPHWECLTVAEHGQRDARFREIDTARVPGGNWMIVLEPWLLELEPQALYDIAQFIRECDGEPPELIYSDGIEVNSNNVITHIDFRPDFNAWWYLGFPFIQDFLVCRRASEDSIESLLLNAIAKNKAVRHIPHALYRRAARPEAIVESRIAAINESLNHRFDSLEVNTSSHTDCLRLSSKVRPGTVSIIIPTRDRRELLEQCIDSMAAETRLSDGVNIELIVVDNDSIEPETLAYFEILREQGHKVVHAPGEFNFSALNNRAAAEASGHYLLFLNNDIEIIDGEWLMAMLEAMALPGTAVVGAKLLYPETGLIQHASDVIGFNGIAGHDHQFFPEKTDGVINTGHQHALGVIRQCMAVTAACMLTQRMIFEQVGGFDEDLHVGFGDTDLCLRIQEAGYQCVVTPFARLIHHESATRGHQSMDPHPLDSDTFLRKWETVVKEGDNFYNDNLARSEADMFAPKVK